MYTQGELAVLADRYSQATGKSLAAIGEESAGNRKSIKRLVLWDQGINAATAERASLWFNVNWPSDTEWPADVPDRRVKRPIPCY